MIKILGEKKQKKKKKKKKKNTPHGLIIEIISSYFSVMAYGKNAVNVCNLCMTLTHLLQWARHNCCMTDFKQQPFDLNLNKDNECFK